MARPPFRSEFLRDLERELIATLRQDLGVALRVAVLAALGFTEAQMQAKLGVDLAEVRGAKALLKRATARGR